MASQQQKKVGIAFSFNLSTEEGEPQTFEKLRVGQHLKLLGVQPGHRPYHHRTHLLLPSHTKVGSFRLTSILFRIQNLSFQGIDEPVRGVECSSSDDLRGEGDGLSPPLVPLQHRRDEHPPRHQRLLQLSHLPLCRKLIQRPGKAPDNFPS